MKFLYRRVFRGFDRGVGGVFRVRGWRDIPHVTVEVATCVERQILTLCTDQRDSTAASTGT